MNAHARKKIMDVLSREVTSSSWVIPTLHLLQALQICITPEWSHDKVYYYWITIINLRVLFSTTLTNSHVIRVYKMFCYSQFNANIIYFTF